jgi:hypothetical protein
MNMTEGDLLWILQVSCIGNSCIGTPSQKLSCYYNSHCRSDLPELPERDRYNECSWMMVCRASSLNCIYYRWRGTEWYKRNRLGRLGPDTTHYGSEIIDSERGRPVVDEKGNLYWEGRHRYTKVPLGCQVLELCAYYWL